MSWLETCRTAGSRGDGYKASHPFPDQMHHFFWTPQQKRVPSRAFLGPRLKMSLFCSLFDSNSGVLQPRNTPQGKRGILILT